MNFAGLSQKIIAAQAPKENMVSGFWQMILDNNVRVIVMITKLVEDSKVKAHAYWPHQKNTSLELENDIKVVLKDQDTKRGLGRRTFKVSNEGEYLDNTQL